MTDRQGTDEREIAKLADNFDLYSPATNECPYDIFRHMRSEAPIHFSEHYGGHWLVVSHEMAQRVARDWRNFTSERGIVLGDPVPRKFAPIEYDPPLHQLFRRFMNPMFSRAAAREYEAPLAMEADRIIDRFIANGRADLTQEYAKPVASFIFFKLMFDLPDEEARFCDQATNDAMFSSDPETRLAGFNRLADYSREIIRRCEQGSHFGPMIETLRTADVGDRKITAEEAAGAIQTMILGGDDTMVHAMGNMFLQLGADLPLRDRLAANPGDIPAAVEESLRHRPPATTISRTVAKDIEYEGHSMKSGQKLCPMWMSANHDESVFPDPEKFDIDRPNLRQQVAFGVGAHRCIGEWIARSMLKVVTERMLARIPDFRVAEGFVPEYRMGQTRGPISVEVEFAPGKALAS